MSFEIGPNVTSEAAATRSRDDLGGRQIDHGNGTGIGPGLPGNRQGRAGDDHGDLPLVLRLGRVALTDRALRVDARTRVDLFMADGASHPCRDRLDQDSIRLRIHPGYLPRESSLSGHVAV